MVALLFTLPAQLALAQQPERGQWGAPAPPPQGWTPQYQPQQYQQPQYQAQQYPPQQAPPQPPPQRAIVSPEVAAADEIAADELDPSSGWFLRARLPSAFPLGFAPHAGPQLEIGLVLDKVHLHVGLAVTTGSLTEEYTDEGENLEDSVSVLGFLAAPGISYVTFRSADHHARLLLQGRGLIGIISASSEGAPTENATAFGLSASVLGEYRVHRSFGTGIEAGYGLALASSSSRGTTQSGTMTGLFVAFTGTVYLGG